MAHAQTEPKLLLPFLEPFYDAVIPLSWLIIRVAVGWNLLVHGWGKIMVGPTPGFLQAFADLGFTPPAFFFWSSFLIEMLGGIFIILGLFTRFFAAAAAIEMAVHRRHLLEQRQRLWLDEARLRICPAVGIDPASPSRCAAAARIRSIASSAGSCNRAAALVSPNRGSYILRRDAQAF